MTIGRKPRVWTMADDARLLELHAEGCSAEQMAERMSVPDERPYSRHHIIKRCTAFGITPRGRRYGPGSRFTDAQIATMQREYLQGASKAQLAKAFDCSPETIRQMIAAGLLCKDPDTAFVDLRALRTKTPKGAQGFTAPVPSAPRPPVPDAPSSDLWRLWERGEASVRQSRGAAA